MTPNFDINIKNISSKNKLLREQSLKLFNLKGFPSKKLEDWKFSDFKNIIEDNFEKINSNNLQIKSQDFELLKDFDHNYLVLINGHLNDKNFSFENDKNIKINEYKEVPTNNTKNLNTLIDLNNALFDGGYTLEVANDYKFKKPLIVYNFFSDDVKNKIINNKNLIILKNNSDLKMIEYSFDTSKNNFIQNNYTNISIGKNASFKNYTTQGCISKGFFYKFIKVSMEDKSNYDDFIFSSGLKFNKIDEEIDINGINSSCNVKSALFLNLNSHQEIQTKVNHLKPDSKSYQKIKNVLNKNCKAAYQGKIYVKDIAQKTNAYQLSKTLILNETSEFNAKPELEIYADDVKCSHGSTSGSMNEDSIYYLMTRGISRKDAIDLLTKAFLFELTETIKDKEIKIFIEKNLERQIYGHQSN